jgi:hypothetical protein
MRNSPAFLAGSVVLLFASVGCLGTRYWIGSRTLRAADMSISLARGTIDLDFDLNIHGFYSINVSPLRDANRFCSDGAGLRTRRISSVGEIPVYRYQWVEDNSRSMGLGDDVIVGEFLGGFEGRRGHYHLRIEVLSNTACLDAYSPRLYIIASNQDFNRWIQIDRNAIWAWMLLAVFGFILAIAGVYEHFRERSEMNNDVTIFKR